MKIMFVCSAGGHLAQILELEYLYNKYDSVIVTEDLEINMSFKKKYNMLYLKSAGKGRDYLFWKNFIINIYLSIKYVLLYRPDVIITTGSHTAIPTCFIGKIRKSKIIYILSYSKINMKAKSANVIYPISDLFIVQWEAAQKLYPKSIYLGGGIY